MPPRYFIGIALPEQISNEISVVQHKFYDDKLLLQPLIPHITIVHPNALAKLSPLWLIPKIKEIQSQLLPIYIELKDLTMFNKNNIHVHIESAQLYRLYQSIVELLPDDVIATHFVGRRPYSPHITVAQAKPKKELNAKLIESYKKELKFLNGIGFKTNKLAKFEHTAPRQYQVKFI